MNRLELRSLAKASPSGVTFALPAPSDTGTLPDQAAAAARGEGPARR